MLLLRWLLQVIDIPNSMTVLPELIPYSLEMVRSELVVPGSARACGQSCEQPPVLTAGIRGMGFETARQV